MCASVMCETRQNPGISITLHHLHPWITRTTCRTNGGRGVRERKYHCSPPTQTIRGKSTRTTTQALSPVQCMRRSKVPCRHHHQHHTSLISKPWYIMLRGFIYYQLSPNPDAPARVAGGAVSIYIIQLAGSPARPLNVHFPFGRRRDVPPSLSPTPPPPSKKTQTPDMQIPDVPCLKPGNH